jgi:alpha-L-fucosidase 2
LFVCGGDIPDVAMEPVKSKMMMYRQIMCVALSAVLFNLTTIQTDAKEWAPDRSGRLMIQKYKTVWTNPPKRTPCRESVDGPVLGNGDMKVAIGGDGAHQRFILCKNDMWRLQHGYGNSSPVPFGTMNVNISGLEGASYKVSQDIYKATTEGAYEMGGSSVRVKCYVAATENVFVLELTAKGKPFTVNMSLDVAEGRGSDSTSGGDGKLFWGKRAFTKAVDVESGVAAAWKLLDLKNPDLMGVRPGISFVLKPGEPVILTLAMDSVFDHKNYQERVKKNVEVIDHNKLIKLKQAHKKWWADYYGKSYVCIGDPVIEKQYYLSLYGMGSCSRNPNFPPAIFGWTTMDRPNWLGDYHLNYNHMAPYYGLARANRLEQADPHDTPLLEFMDRAKWHCQEIFGFDGVMYPVGIGPKGIESTYGNARYISRGTTVAENKGLFWGQRTNAAYALVNMAPRWYTTYDLDYGKKIYPFVLQTATFWENYVIWDKANNRYIIDKDSVHEGSGQDMNSCLSLGLVRNALLLALDLSKEMNINADRCDKWNHILKHLSNYTFQEKDGKKVFRYTEKGKAWWRNNTLGIQQIYPAGQIHLDSDLELLAVSKNTIDVMGATPLSPHESPCDHLTQQANS